MKFKDRNLMNVNPMKEQFAPTPAQPIRQHARMAGDPVGGEAEEEGSLRATKAYGAYALGKGPKQESDKSLHAKARAGDSSAKKELIRRINKPVVD